MKRTRSIVVQALLFSTGALVAGGGLAQPETSSHREMDVGPGLALTSAAHGRELPRMDVLTDHEWNRIDQSIRRGLTWLADRQGSDGSFPTDHTGNPGVTSLCVLAMMSGNHFPDSGDYGIVLSRAIKYILSTQKPNGLISVSGPDGPSRQWRSDGRYGSAGTYNHAISALALSESYAMTHSQSSAAIRQAIVAATQCSLDFQRRRKMRRMDEGGWRYLYHSREMDSDLSITGWYLMSLRSAKNAGFDVPQAAIDAAVDYVMRCFHPREGTFLYGLRSHRVRSRAMAGAGILALAHAGRHDSPAVTAAGDWILRHPFTSYNELRFQKDTFHYGAFYCCQATYQLGGHYWEEFYPRMARILVENQHTDGGWQRDAAGSENRYGRAYTTSLAVLALSAPNQVLPIFQR